MYVENKKNMCTYSLMPFSPLKGPVIWFMMQNYPFESHNLIAEETFVF